MQDDIDHESSNYSAFSIYLEPETKAVKKQLKDYMDNKYNVRLKGIGFLSNKDVLYAEETKIEAISEKKMDFYAKVVKEDGRTKLSFFGGFGYDVKINPTQDYAAYRNLRKTMVGFLNDYLPGYYTDQVEEVEDVVEDLREEKEDLNDDIADNKEDITKKLEDIKQLRKENQELAEKLSETSTKLTESEKDLQSTKMELNKVNTQLKKLVDNQ